MEVRVNIKFPKIKQKNNYQLLTVQEIKVNSI